MSLYVFLFKRTSICLSIYLSYNMSFYLSMYLSIEWSIGSKIYLSMNRAFSLSYNVFIYISINISVIYASYDLSINQPIKRSISPVCSVCSVCSICSNCSDCLVCPVCVSIYLYISTWWSTDILTTLASVNPLAGADSSPVGRNSNPDPGNRLELKGRASHF